MLGGLFLINILLVMAIGLMFIFEGRHLVRILYLNIMTNIISLALAVLGTFQANSSYIDIALIYFFLGVVANIAYLKYYSEKELEQPPRD